MSWILALLLPACGDRSSDGSRTAALLRSAPPGPGQSGATVAYENGHPLDWWTDDPGVLSHEDQVFAMVNQHRTSRGLSALTLDPDLRRCARGHSRHMRPDSHDFVAHVNPEGHGPTERAIFCDVPNVVGVGENAAAGQATPFEVFNGWLNSPSHRANIEDPSWRRSGVGYQPGPAGDPMGHYWTQLFAP